MPLAVVRKWLQENGRRNVHPFGPVVLEERLRDALHRLNPTIPEDALEETLRKVLRLATPSPEQIDAAVRQLVSKAITTDGQHRPGQH